MVIINNNCSLLNLNYSRPAIFENEDEDYQYSIFGTSFGIEYKKRFFIITAKHVYDNFDSSEISIMYEYPSEKFLPLKEELFINNYQIYNDCQQFDIVIFEIDQEEIDASFNHETFYRIKDRKVYPEHFKIGQILGFPQILNTLDYESKQLKFRRFELEVLIIRKGSKYKNLHCIEYSDKHKPYMNGMSGSPVYGKQKILNHTKSVLIGMLVLEKYFISITHIKSILKKGFFN